MRNGIRRSKGLCTGGAGSASAGDGKGRELSEIMPVKLLLQGLLMQAAVPLSERWEEVTHDKNGLRFLCRTKMTA